MEQKKSSIATIYNKEIKDEESEYHLPRQNAAGY